VAEPLDAALLRSIPLPAPAEGDKDARGRVFAVAGAPQLPGAAVLCGTAVLRAGAGKVQIGTCESVAGLVGIAVPEALVIALPERRTGAIAGRAAETIVEAANATDALVFGPGLAEPQAASALAVRVARDVRTPCVIDAGALGCFAGSDDVVRHLEGRAVLTPHSGEMATMMRVAKDEIESDPAGWVVRAAERFGCVVVLKGATTHIADEQGALYRHDGGSVGLATSGSGDTLAGIVAGFIARGAPVLTAALWGVAVHARAGANLERRIGLGFLAREILREIPGALRQLERGCVT
jgi:hydroxyethylthiazole kinase-like uncharacterized protein yjeF